MAAPDSIACETGIISVNASHAMDAQDACRGAAAAWSFFVAHGLLPEAPILIDVVATLPERVSATAAGCYLKHDNRVLILPFETFQTNETWFNIPIDRRLYRSLAAHEAAHAMAASLFAVPHPTIQAKEYVAYVAMFAGMDPALRAEVLNAMPGTGFDSADRITAIFYLFDPMRFGTQAYRHYLKGGNGPEFLRAVLSGKALAN